MRKMKATAVLTTAALMALGASFTAMAANGWAREDGTWRYYDKYGDYVTEKWAKSGTEEYYLDEDGYLAINMLIEDGDNLYATNSAGKKIKNEWREFQDEDDDEFYWYWFQGTGKAKKDGFLTIGGEKYHFTDGKMDTGWINDNGDIYYLSEDEATLGAVKTGWVYINDVDEDDQDILAEEEGWYYFGNTGKMLANQEKKINGEYYVFDENGLMLDNWVAFTTGGTATESNASAAETIYKYYKDGDGDRVDGWKYLDEMTEDEGRATEEGWYYFKNGVPYSATINTTPIAEGYGVAKIDGKIYCFDENGLMVTGRVDADNGTYFYFDEDLSDGSMKYGKVQIENSDDFEDGTYYFDDKGALGVKGASKTGVIKDYLYDNGALVTADEDMKYARVEVDGLVYMVNESGKIKKSGTVKDGDDVKWSITKDEVNGGYIVEVVVED